MNDDERLDRLKTDLSSHKSVKDKENKDLEDKKESNESMQVGLRAGTELITSIAAGGFIGYLIDQWLETKPIFLIAMLILGVITGFVNVWRTTQNMGHQVGFKDVNKNN